VVPQTARFDHSRRPHGRVGLTVSRARSGAGWPGAALDAAWRGETGVDGTVVAGGGGVARTVGVRTGVAAGGAVGAGVAAASKCLALTSVGLARVWAARAPAPNGLALVPVPRQWLHTTWSHQPDEPTWRVVIPLARPVVPKRWANVWRRAHASLCPEADPSCKDASRQYYLPSHPAGVVGEIMNHAGQLLDPSMLPELPRAAR
jgi:hypothetical protein